MKVSRLWIILVAVPLFAFTTMHKYYISVTQIDYVEEKKSVQITSRIFIDDFERVLRMRYDESLTLDEDEESKTTDSYIERYLQEKIKIKINDKSVPLVFIGKEYDMDILRCYLEVERVENIKSFEVNNQVLFDVFEEQQNIVKTKINAQQKSFLLIPQKANAVLKFN